MLSPLLHPIAGFPRVRTLFEPLFGRCRADGQHLSLTALKSSFVASGFDLAPLPRGAATLEALATHPMGSSRLGRRAAPDARPTCGRFRPMTPFAASAHAHASPDRRLCPASVDVPRLPRALFLSIEARSAPQSTKYSTWVSSFSAS